MNNSGLSTSISGSDNLPTNGGINAPNDTERNFPSVNNVDGSLRNVTTASNSDSMQVPAGTTAGKTDFCAIRIDVDQFEQFCNILAVFCCFVAPYMLNLTPIILCCSLSLSLCFCTSFFATISCFRYHTREILSTPLWQLRLPLYFTSNMFFSVMTSFGQFFSFVCV